MSAELTAVSLYFFPHYSLLVVGDLHGETVDPDENEEEWSKPVKVTDTTVMIQVLHPYCEENLSYITIGTKTSPQTHRLWEGTISLPTQILTLQALTEDLPAYILPVRKDQVTLKITGSHPIEESQEYVVIDIYDVSNELVKSAIYQPIVY